MPTPQAGTSASTTRDGCEHTIKLLDALDASSTRGRQWTLRGCRNSRPASALKLKRRLSRRNKKPSDGLEPSTPLSVERPILSRTPDSPSGATRLRDRPALQHSYLSTPDRGAGHDLSCGA